MTDAVTLDFSMLKKGLVIGPEHRQFRLIKPVSNSPIGQVWHADDLSTATESTRAEKAALEIVNPKLLQDDHTLNAFKALVTQCKQLKHKHIAKTYGYFQSREGWLFVAMEPVTTRSLARILMEDGYQQLSVEKSRIILSQIAQAIDYATTQKISHGDLTPWNVIITHDSGVKLVNFAFRQPLLQKIQADGHRILNSEFHAPESFISVPLPTTVDIYAFACIAYQLFSGFPPFPPELPVDDREADTLPAPKKMSEEQWQTLRPALSASPGDRPLSAVELTNALFPSKPVTPVATGNRPEPEEPDTSERAEAVPESVLRASAPREPAASGASRMLITASTMFALGLVIGYLVATNQYRSHDEQLLKALGAIHNLTAQPPTPENKVALNRYFAELKSLTDDAQLVQALGKQVEGYKVRLSRDRVEDQQVPGSPADVATDHQYQQEQQASAFLPGAVFKDEIMPEVFGPNMVVLPAGTYLMGDQDRNGDDNEQPVHPVKISKPFALSQHEVTFADYDLFALSTDRPLPDDEGWGRGNRPVINISWNDANAYTYWLRKQTGLDYRLPTEAEWEYAARAGTDTPFWWGEDVGRGNANCDECGSLWDGKKSAPVGSFKPNPFGLYDMNGNVYEWVSDCYNENYIQAPSDGSSWDVGLCNLRVMRGGSWYDIGRLIRSASRYRHPPNASRNTWGFRLALDLK
ncbi:SUMF1/EgtB/PvdO family nonheme iron enzyme [Motiliproteus sediminis]|uniref:SUMF1/EgtB/PvdO family nonheme iron enzyme n=1 Tax=Motiliproteus sediminis TaxID=1468178 RepID=UPI001AEFB262|nr:SUMF1/EgtB/PvdO family nonheme iron enzyme [Motiliproteus sediminis]